MRWGSFSTIVLQCFFTMEGRAGNLGSYITANTGLLVSLLSILTLFRASFLGISFALLIAEFIILFLYFLSNKNCFNSSSLLSLVCGSLNSDYSVGKGKGNVFCDVGRVTGTR